MNKLKKLANLIQDKIKAICISLMRDDESKESLRLEEVLENVPSKHGNFVRVRSVLGDQ